MGWDADATKDGEMLETQGDDVRRLQLVDPVLRAAFTNAAARVERGWGSGKMDMAVGQLDGWGYQLVIARATGGCCFDITIADGMMDWSPQTVQRLSAGADWNFPVECETDEAYPDWYGEHEYHEARLFLETCAELGLGVRFSW